MGRSKTKRLIDGPYLGQGKFLYRDGPGGYMEQRLKEPVRFVSAGVQDPKQQLDQSVHEAQQQQQQQQQQRLHFHQPVPLHPPSSQAHLYQASTANGSSASADPAIPVQPPMGGVQGGGEQAVHGGPQWMGSYWGDPAAAAAAASATGDAGAYAQWCGGMPSWGAAGCWPSGWEQWYAYYGYGSSTGENPAAAAVAGGPHLGLGWHSAGGVDGRRSEAEGDDSEEEGDTEQGRFGASSASHSPHGDDSDRRSATPAQAAQPPHGVCIPPPSACLQPPLPAHDPCTNSAQQQPQQQSPRSSSPALPPPPPTSSLPAAPLPPHLQHLHQPPSSLPLPPPPLPHAPACTPLPPPPAQHQQPFGSMPLPPPPPLMPHQLHSMHAPQLHGSMSAEGSPTPEPDGGAPVDTRTRNAKKKANKRAREQGLPPPGITPPPGGPSHHPPKQQGAPGAGAPPPQGGAGPSNQGLPSGEPNSKKARKAAAEAALTRFAGFEEHTSGIGSKLLEKMGWKSGEGLGQKAQGIYEPVMPKIVTGKRGLGAN